MPGSRSIPTFISTNEIGPSEGAQQRSSRPGLPVARVSRGGLCPRLPPAPTSLGSFSRALLPLRSVRP